MKYYLEHGESELTENQTTFEDRYHNNPQGEYSIERNDVNVAATKIQAQYRGHRIRRNLDKIKQESKDVLDSDYEQLINFDDENQKPSYSAGARLQRHENGNKEDVNTNIQGEDELSKERAATSIQAQFRGFQVRKNLRESSGNTNEQEQEFGNHYNNIFTRTIDHRALDGRSQTFDENKHSDHLRFQRELKELSNDILRHTHQIPDSDFDQNQQQEEADFNDDSDGDMSDSDLDKAATRIQASYRGYKTRKELGTGTGSPGTSQDLPPDSSPTHAEYDNVLSPSAEGNKSPIGEDDDNAAAAVKIQAAYRGYRVRKDLEK